MDSPVQQIKERLSIEEVVSSYIKLEKAGVNWKAKCPFHNEKTPSFFVSPGRGSYYCFGCAAGGDVFTFVEEFEGLDFRGALKLLAERAGVTLPQYDSRKEKETASEKERLYKIMEESAKYFENNLAENSKAVAYLKSRGLSDESIKSFRIGFAKQDWRTLHDYLLKQDFSTEDMEKAGLVKRSEKAVSAGGQGFYDRFRSRIMFPVSDSSGRVIAFSGRIFEEGLPKEEVEKSAKYLNSPETPLFNKSAVLYGIDRAKESIRKNNFSILVEGQMDLVLSHQAGFKNTVASSGTALSDGAVAKENAVSNLGLVRRLSNNIVLAYDADKAGFSAANRAGRIALSFGMDVKVASLPEGVDPADLIVKEGGDAWRKAIRESKHLIEFVLDRAIFLGASDQRKAGREIKENVLPYVASLDSEIEKTHFLRLISGKSGLSEDALRADLKKAEESAVSEKKEVTSIRAEEAQVFRKDHIRQKLLGIVLWQKSIPNPSLDVEEILRELSVIYGVGKEELLVREKEDKEDLIFEAEVFYQGGADLKKDTDELLLNLKEEHLKDELENKMIELRKAEEEKNLEKSSRILKECKEINDKIQDIKNNIQQKI